MKFVQPLVALVYAVIFYLVGVVALAPFEVLLNVVVFTVALVLGFSIKVSSIEQRVTKALDGAEASGSMVFKLSYYPTIFALLLVFALMYSEHGVPIFSSSVEVDRMVLVNEYGVIYRIATQLLFFFPPLIMLAGKYGWVSKFGAYSQLTLVFLLLLSMGFRSRILDYMAVVAITTLFLGVDRGMLWRVLPKLVLFSFVGLGLVVLLTFLREESSEDFVTSIYSVYYRAFLLNYDVNFNRVFVFSENMGVFYGATFFNDIVSLFSSSVDSMQVVITKYFNKVNSDLFIMTPTVYGEFFVNFAGLGFLFVAPILMLYRFVFEGILVIFSRLPLASAIYFPVFVNYIYYVPRQVVTGGISNAFIIRGVSIMLVAACLYFIVFFMLPYVKGRAR